MAVVAGSGDAEVGIAVVAVEVVDPAVAAGVVVEVPSVQGQAFQEQVSHSPFSSSARVASSGVYLAPSGFPDLLDLQSDLALYQVSEEHPYPDSYSDSYSSSLHHPSR